MVIAITTTVNDCCNKETLISAEEDIAMYRHPFVKAYIGRGKGEKEGKRKTYTAYMDLILKHISTRDN